MEGPLSVPYLMAMPVCTSPALGRPRPPCPRAPEEPVRQDACAVFPSGGGEPKKVAVCTVAHPEWSGPCCPQPPVCELGCRGESARECSWEKGKEDSVFGQFRISFPSVGTLPSTSIRSART